MAALASSSSSRICGQWGGKRQLPFQAHSRIAKNTHSRIAVRRVTLVAKAEQSKQKVIAVLYKAGKAAENKDLLGCVENELGLREFLEEQVSLACTACEVHDARGVLVRDVYSRVLRRDTS